MDFIPIYNAFTDANSRLQNITNIEIPELRLRIKNATIFHENNLNSLEQIGQQLEYIKKSVENFENSAQNYALLLAQQSGEKYEDIYEKLRQQTILANNNVKTLINGALKELHNKKTMSSSSMVAKFEVLHTTLHQYQNTWSYRFWKFFVFKDRAIKFNDILNENLSTSKILKTSLDRLANLDDKQKATKEYTDLAKLIDSRISNLEKSFNKELHEGTLISEEDRKLLDANNDTSIKDINKLLEARVKQLEEKQEQKSNPSAAL